MKFACLRYTISAPIKPLALALIPRVLFIIYQHQTLHSLLEALFNAISDSSLAEDDETENRGAGRAGDDSLSLSLFSELEQDISRPFTYQG